MSKITGYFIARGIVAIRDMPNDPIALEKTVRDAIAEGWQPFGPTFKIGSMQRGQAMVRYEEEARSTPHCSTCDCNP